MATLRYFSELYSINEDIKKDELIDSYKSMELHVHLNTIDNKINKIKQLENELLENLKGLLP